MSTQSIYLPGLNGIRAIAAIGVVVSHITRRGADFGLDPYLFGSYEGETVGWDLAEFGVTMFFTLSGFLITYLLLIERQNAPVNILKFYMRRILRIWPLYYAYILVCVIVWFLFQLHPNYDVFAFYIFFAANVPFIMSASMPFLIHFWSLGVEEQFYLFWPWFTKFGLRTMVTLTILIIVILVSVKVSLHLLYPNSLFEKIIHVTRFHCMLIGCLVALLYYQRNVFFQKFFEKPLTQAIGWIGIATIVVNKFHIVSLLDHEFVSIITAAVIVGQITKKGLISLENRIMDVLGKLSYGIYIIHPVLIFLLSKILKDITDYMPLNYFIVYGAILMSTILLASISYRYLEKPFLRLKSKKYTVLETTSMGNTN